MTLRVCWLLPAALLFTGCGREEKREATNLVKVLIEKKAELAGINALEKDLLGSTHSWCESIVAGGAGKGKQLEENATSAKGLAQSAEVIASQLSQLRQSIYNQPLKQEYPQSVRGALINSIMKRQKMLQEIRMALDASATNFLEFAQSRAYNGDTYPAGIVRLNQILSSYHGPEDVLGKAIDDLKVKYAIQDADLVVKT